MTCVTAGLAVAAIVTIGGTTVSGSSTGATSTTSNASTSIATSTTIANGGGGVDPTPTASTAPSAVLADGVFTDPAASYTVAFATEPALVVVPDATSTSYLVNVDEDSQAVSSFVPSALGVAPAASAAEHVAAFLAASGTDIEQLVGTSTRLGPLPAAHFIARLTLASGARAVVYGVVVVRDADVTYAVYTDVGTDDGDGALAFVESFTVLIDPLPAPPVPPVPPTPGAPSTSAGATTTTVPDGVTESFDRRWWVRFPGGADVSLRASTQGGFAYAEYLGESGAASFSVRVVELPLELDVELASWADDEAQRLDATVTRAEPATLGTYPGLRATLRSDDGTVELVLVRAGRQLYVIMATSSGSTPSDDAVDFVTSFHLR